MELCRRVHVSFEDFLLVGSSAKRKLSCCLDKWKREFTITPEAVEGPTVTSMQCPCRRPHWRPHAMCNFWGNNGLQSHQSRRPLQLSPLLGVQIKRERILTTVRMAETGNMLEMAQIQKTSRRTRFPPFEAATAHVTSARYRSPARNSVEI